MTSPTTVTDYWTTRAEGYSDRTADELAGPRGLIWEKRLRDALHTAPEGLVVDLGCGPGLFTLLAARTGREALGIDLTPKMLRQARTNHRRFAPQSSVSFLAADAEHLPLSDHSVAAVVSASAENHKSPANTSHCLAESDLFSVLFSSPVESRCRCAEY